MTKSAMGFCGYILSSYSATEPERLCIYLDLIGEPVCRTTGTIDHNTVTFPVISPRNCTKGGARSDAITHLSFSIS